VNGIVTVKDASGAAVRGANVAATWTKPNGTIQSQTASQWFSFFGSTTMERECCIRCARGFS